MTREEAIKILDPESSAISATDIVEKWENISEMVREAHRMAISALRAQQTKMDRNRWDGCEYCNDTLKNYRYINACDIGKRSLIYDTPRYCPICGRPLTEEAWAELERMIT